MGARGPKTGYTPDCCDEARRACMLGATNEELAGLLGVSRATIHNWMEEFPDFRKAIEEGKVAADARVAEKLYQRAIGYERPATRFFANPDGPPTQVDYTYHHAPDTSAAIFWLRNRRREDWREQVEHRHSTSHELLVVLEAARLRARPGMGERSGEATPVAALPAPAEGNCRKRSRTRSVPGRTAMSGATDAKAELHRDDRRLRPRSAGLRALRLSLGRARHAAGGRRRPGGLAVRRAAAAGAGAGEPAEAVRLAVASGHGIGKSALVSWIILWALSTMHDTRGVVSANTEAQLRTKTWPELAKWHALAINRDWFAYTATALHSVLPGKDRTWRVDCITWSENNTEAIAGLHNKGRRAFALLDEASAIPDAVWETIEGALTDADTELFWASSAIPRATPAASANASPAAASPIAGATARSIRARSA